MDEQTTETLRLADLIRQFSDEQVAHELTEAEAVYAEAQATLQAVVRQSLETAVPLALVTGAQAAYRRAKWWRDLLRSEQAQRQAGR
jgi:phage gp46-like protein